MERKHEFKFNLHDVEKEELEKFLADNPHFHGMDSLIRIAVFEYVYAVKESQEHITKECIKLISG